MIVSDAKAAANRANAQASTGPRSAQGKATVSRNAQVHGLYGAGAPDAGEDRAAFNNLYDDLRTRFVPDGIAETALVARLASILWRLSRVSAAEHAVYAEHEQDFVPANDGGPIDVAVDLPQLWGRAHAAGHFDSAIGRINRHEAHLQRMAHRTLDMLMALQGLRDGVDPVAATKANARAQAQAHQAQTKPAALEAAVQNAMRAKEQALEDELGALSPSEFGDRLNGLFDELRDLTGGERDYRLTAAAPATDPGADDPGQDTGSGSAQS